MSQPQVVVNDAEVYLSFAAELADAARPIVLSYFRTSMDVVSKSDESPVTIADRTIEWRLRERIEARFPEHGIFGAILIIVAALAWAKAALSIWRADETARRSFRWRAGATGLWIVLLCAVASIVDYPLRVPSFQLLVAVCVLWIIRSLHRPAADRTGDVATSSSQL